MAKLDIVSSKAFVGLIVALVAFLAIGPYVSGTSFATIKNTQDFTVTNVVLPSVVAGLSFDVQATFANLGDVSGTSVRYSYEITDSYNRVYYNEGVIDNLLAGETETVVVPVNDELRSGKYSMIITVDSSSVFTESDETNNAYSVEFTVR